MRISALVIAAAVLLLGAAAPASAHTRSQSSSSISLEGTSVTVEFRVAAREATRLSVLDEDAQNLQGLLAGHLLQAIRVRADGTECMPGTPRPLSADTASLRLEIAFDCPALGPDGVFTLTNNAFFPVASSHIHFARARDADGRFIETLFTDTNRTHEFALGAGAAKATPPVTDVIADYVALGIEHILAGADHVAFLLGLLLLCRRLRDVVLVVTGFTIGHSITLSIAVLGIAQPNVPVVEALIGFTVALVAAESLLAEKGLMPRVALWAAGPLAVMGLAGIWFGSTLNALVWIGLPLFVAGYGVLVHDGPTARRLMPVITTLFGLIHGFGFANVLMELDLPTGRLAGALFGFNVGVEIGQLMLVAVVWSLATLAGSRLPDTLQRTVPLGAGAVLCLVGSYWFALRAFG